jgi:hypothetical protein
VQAERLGQRGRLLPGEEERLWMGGDRAGLRAGLGRAGTAHRFQARCWRNVLLPGFARMPGDGVEGGLDGIDQACKLVTVETAGEGDLGPSVAAALHGRRVATGDQVLRIGEKHGGDRRGCDGCNPLLPEQLDLAGEGWGTAVRSHEESLNGWGGGPSSDRAEGAAASPDGMATRSASA